MFSRRVLLQWQGQPVGEPTSTYVLTSPGFHFVDLRILDASYPYNKLEKDSPYEEVFDWVSSGVEQEVKGTDEIKFKLEIDSLEVNEALKLGKPIEECRRATDLGFFSAIPGSEDRKETGNMVNPEVGEKQDYIEIWRSLDPEKHSPTTEVRESASGSEGLLLSVLVTDLDHFEGKIVRLGNWVQGLVHDKKSHQLHVVRAWYNGDKLEYLIKFGDIEIFDLDFTGAKGDATEKKALKWVCIEASS